MTSKLDSGILLVRSKRQSSRGTQWAGPWVWCLMIFNMLLSCCRLMHTSIFTGACVCGPSAGVWSGQFIFGQQCLQVIVDTQIVRIWISVDTCVCIPTVTQTRTDTYIQDPIYISYCGVFSHTSIYGSASAIPTTDKLRDCFFLMPYVSSALFSCINLKNNS